jgi:hypothetical protein
MGARGSACATSAMSELTVREEKRPLVRLKGHLDWQGFRVACGPPRVRAMVDLSHTNWRKACDIADMSQLSAASAAPAANVMSPNSCRQGSQLRFGLWPPRHVGRNESGNFFIASATRLDA